MKARTHRLLERFSPPGLDVAREVRALRTGGVVAFIFSLTFFLRFFPARQALFRWDGLTYVLVSGEQMADFSVCWRGAARSTAFTFSPLPLC